MGPGQPPFLGKTVDLLETWGFKFRQVNGLGWLLSVSEKNSPQFCGKGIIKDLVQGMCLISLLFTEVAGVHYKGNGTPLFCSSQHLQKNVQYSAVLRMYSLW